jgi:hypothetical protein
MITRGQPASPALAVPSWLLSWRGAAGLTATAAGAIIVTGALLPWAEEFAGLVTISGVRGSYGRILVAVGALIAVAGIWQLARGGQASRWLAGLAGFAATGFSGYLLIQLTRTMNTLGGDSMVLARSGPGLPVVLGGSVAAFATLLFPPSTQTTLRRDRSAPALAWAADRQATGLRRGLTLALGGLWLVDAALQFQPYMFGRSMVATMLAPMEANQPGVIGGPVALLARLVAENPVPWNAAFATIQLALGVGLLLRATTRAALAGTIAWSLGVWWLGEGMGQIFTGAASPLTGAPGAALLYALLALLIWPARNDDGRPGSRVTPAGPRGRAATFAWVILWGGLACLMLTAPNGASALTAAGGGRADLIRIAFTVAFALAAAGVLLPAAARPALAISVIAAAILWAAGEHFGALLSGQATDPNTGPLLILIALARWPRAKATPIIPNETGGAVR